MDKLFLFFQMTETVDLCQPPRSLPSQRLWWLRGRVRELSTAKHRCLERALLQMWSPHLQPPPPALLGGHQADYQAQKLTWVCLGSLLLAGHTQNCSPEGVQEDWVPQPTQLTPLNVEEQWLYSEFLSDDWTSHPLCEGESNQERGTRGANSSHSAANCSSEEWSCCSWVVTSSFGSVLISWRSNLSVHYYKCLQSNFHVHVEALCAPGTSWRVISINRVLVRRCFGKATSTKWWFLTTMLRERNWFLCSSGLFFQPQPIRVWDKVKTHPCLWRTNVR